MPAATKNDTHKLPGLATKVGNLTGDPELRFGKDKGTPFVTVGLAVNTPKVPGDWAGEQQTSFYDLALFGSLAEHVADSLAKGTRVIVVGRPEVEQYTAEDGTSRERKRILVDALGPDLRWANATVTRGARTSPATATAATEDEGPF